MEAQIKCILGVHMIGVHAYGASEMVAEDETIRRSIDF